MTETTTKFGWVVFVTSIDGTVPIATAIVEAPDAETAAKIAGDEIAEEETAIAHALAQNDLDFTYLREHFAYRVEEITHSLNRFGRTV